MGLPAYPSLETLGSSYTRVLLINGPAIDTRPPWARWQQPAGLLRIGALLRARQCDVRLIDCLQTPSSGRLPRQRVARLGIDGRNVDIWRFGLSPATVLAQIQAWSRQGWKPDKVLVSCGISTWWQGARDVIIGLRSTACSDVPVLLGGAYPTFYPEHATKNAGADEIVVGDVTDALAINPDLSLYKGTVPRFAAIRLYSPAGILTSAVQQQARLPKEVAEEVRAAASLGVTTFAFYDNWLGPDDRDTLKDALEGIAALELPNIRFVAVGNLSPRAVDTELAKLLRKVGFRHIYLHDDVRHTAQGPEYLSSEDDYIRCVHSLGQAGFRVRTDEVSAGVLAGIPGEDLGALVSRLVRLASIVGSVNLVPYQYTPGTAEATNFETLMGQRNGEIDPAALNAQLYPLVKMAGAKFEDYLELTRLAALLNSKYRSQTFDFRGNGLIARLVRNSLRNELWNPFRKSCAAAGAAAPAVLGEQR